MNCANSILLFIGRGSIKIVGIKLLHIETLCMVYHMYRLLRVLGEVNILLL